MLTYTDNVTISLSSGDKPETYEVPALAGAQLALTLCVSRIEDRIALLSSSPARATIKEINENYADVIGSIRMITVMTGLLPYDEGQIVHSLRTAAFAARKRALDRRSARKELTHAKH